MKKTAVAPGSGGSITLGTADSTAVVKNQAGSHTVAAKVTLARDTEFDTAAGASLVVSGGVDGTGNLTKKGAGTLNITSTGGNLSGTTTVAAGLLKVNANLSSSAVTVQSGATLGGSGTVGDTVIQSGATLAPGNSPGTLNVSGNLVWQSGGNYNWQLLDAAGTAGSGWDFTEVTGNLVLTGLSAASPFNINLWTLSSSSHVTGDVNGFANNFNAAETYTWTIAHIGGTIVGSFDPSFFNIRRNAANGTAGFANTTPGGSGFHLSIEYLEAGGAKLSLVYTPVPEPSTYGLMLGGLALAVAAFRRRRRA